MENVPLFDAITILVGVSVFSTGFLSIRLHAKRDRLLGRVNQIGQHLKDPTTLQGEQYNYGTRLILEEFKEYKEANKPDVIAVATAVGNIGVFILVLFLSILIALTKGWQFTTNLLKVAPEFWALTAITLVEFGVAALGAFEVYFIHKDITNRLKDSFAMKLSNATIHANRKEFDKALKFYNEIVEGWPATHLSYFLRGKAYLDEGDVKANNNDPQKAKECYALAHADFLMSSEHFASSSIYNFAGEASLKAGDYEQAMLETTRAITIDPSNARAYTLRADAHEMLGNVEQAQKDRQEARKLKPTSAKALPISQENLSRVAGDTSGRNSSTSPHPTPG